MASGGTLLTPALGNSRLVPANSRPAMAIPRPAASSQALARFITPLRVGDPLGLGTARPAPPEDPDPYDITIEDAEFARSLLTDEKKAEIDEEIAKNGFMKIENIRKFISDNVSPDITMVVGLDPEMLIVIDSNINYKIFLDGDHVYTREELYDHFAFHEIGTQPEAVFLQQEIGIFPSDDGSDAMCYLARDVGDERVEFMMVEDMIGQIARKNYQLKRELIKVVKTKIYIGKEPWEDFKAMEQLMRATIRASRSQYAAGGQPAGMFAMLQAAAPLMLTDAATEAAAKSRREAELARREAELAQREEKINADIRRLEDMFRRRSRVHKPDKVSVPDSVPVDSVPVNSASVDSASVDSASVDSALVDSASVDSVPLAALANLLRENSIAAITAVNPICDVINTPPAASEIQTKYPLSCESNDLATAAPHAIALNTEISAKYSTYTEPVAAPTAADAIAATIPIPIKNQDAIIMHPATTPPTTPEISVAVVGVSKEDSKTSTVMIIDGRETAAAVPPSDTVEYRNAAKATDTTGNAPVAAINWDVCLSVENLGEPVRGLPAASIDELFEAMFR